LLPPLPCASAPLPVATFELWCRKPWWRLRSQY
jgi:hypothetical protein